jgi:hypothetical protein
MAVRAVPPHLPGVSPGASVVQVPDHNGKICKDPRHSPDDYMYLAPPKGSKEPVKAKVQHCDARHGTVFQRTYILRPTASAKVADLIVGAWEIKGRLGWILAVGGAFMMPFAALADVVKVLSYPLRLAWNAATGDASDEQY